MVSHDREEVLRLADRVIKIEKGKKLKEGSPLQVLLDETPEGLIALRGKVVSFGLNGNKKVFVLEVRDELLRFELQKDKELRVGDEVVLYLRAVGLKTD